MLRNRSRGVSKLLVHSHGVRFDGKMNGEKCGMTDATFDLPLSFQIARANYSAALHPFAT